MRAHADIEIALECARTKLQPDEHILAAGREMRKREAPITKGAWTLAGVILFAFVVGANVHMPFLFPNFIFVPLGCILPVLCFVAPILDVVRNSFPMQQICILTNQRVLTVHLDSLTVTELGQREEVFKIETKSNLVTFAMRNGIVRSMKAVEGLSLPQVSTSSED